MGKKDDSNLRAGFVRDVDPIKLAEQERLQREEQLRREAEAIARKEEEAALEAEAQKRAEAAEGSDAASEDDDKSGTTITQMGVSGKLIKSVVKKIRVVKKKRPEEVEETPPSPEAETDDVLELKQSELELESINASSDPAPQEPIVFESERVELEVSDPVSEPELSSKAEEIKVSEPATLASEELAASEPVLAVEAEPQAESAEVSPKKRSKRIKLDEGTEQRLLEHLHAGTVPQKLKSGRDVRAEQELEALRKIEEEKRKLLEQREREQRELEEALAEQERLAKKHAEERKIRLRAEEEALRREKEEQAKRLASAISGPRKVGNINDMMKSTAEGAVKPAKSKSRSTAASRAAIEATKILENRHRAKHESSDELKSDVASATTPPPQTQVDEMAERLGINMPRKLGKMSDTKGSSSLAATAARFTQRQQRSSSQGSGGRNQRYQNPAFDKDEDDKKPRSSPRNPRRKPAAVDNFLQDIGGREAASRNFQNRNQFDRNKGRDNAGSRNNRGRNFRDNRNNNFLKRGYDDDGFQRRGRRKPSKSNEEATSLQKAAQVSHVFLPSHLTVKEFAEAIKKSSAEVIMKLMGLGMMATVNNDIDYDTAALLAGEFSIEAEPLIEVSTEEKLFDDSEDIEENLVERSPVVVVMGHVDHGKTSLLDYIRNARVTAGEAGGITQAIGAYQVQRNGRDITFLDTPGHEAFTAMRARGAQATDIAILVVAADDGVMPQTIEAINHAKQAGTEIIVAINKIDKPGANVERVRQELTQYELVPEDWGGSTVMVPISAKTGEGVDELLEMVLLTADVMELKADPNRQAKGFILEARLDPHRGAVASLLVQRGTLHKGDTILTSSIVGNIRAMVNEHGEDVDSAGPSVPVEILGLPAVPLAGEVFYQVSDERMARQYAEELSVKQREDSLHAAGGMSLDSLYEKMSQGEVKDLNLIVKADVVGSVEAMKQSLEKLSNDEVKVHVIHGAAGGINESDIRLAEVTDAIIIGFNVRTTGNVGQLAKDAGVDIRLYRVIYNAIEEVEAAMKGMLAPEFKEEVMGHIEIRETFHVSSVGTIGGGYVLDGKIERNSDVRLVRDGVVITEGKLASLRRFKDDVKEVREGFECGLSLERYNDIKIGDVVEAFRMVEVERD
ncbi:MAG: translation initiation factor IF-2 [Eubacteriales bacterium]|nr:translation initiation factor IF-2 [Eubacteriales bacterium]